MTKSVIIKGLVSTIIPVYNRPEMIHRAVNSVLAQTYRPIEIILINDGSTDNTGEVLDSLAKQHPHIIDVIHKENGGAGLARETGRLVARGEYIQYLDSDDWLYPNKFEDQVKALRKNPDCGIAYGMTRRVSERGDTLQEASKWTGEQFDYLFPALLVDRWWHTHTPLYTRTISDLAGSWSSKRPEDWDLEARMGKHKVKLVNCGTLVSCHLSHPSPNRVSFGSQVNYLKDEAWFLPRLYACAIQAGVNGESPEMAHFSKWTFMRARHLGALGENKLADDLLQLARRSSPRSRISMRVIAIMANIIGWKSTGKLCSWLEKIKPAHRVLPEG